MVKMLLFSFAILLFVSCSNVQAERNAVGMATTESANVPALLEFIEVYADPNCSKTFNEVRWDWDEKASTYTNSSIIHYPLSENQKCAWVRLVFQNQDSVGYNKILYFPSGWSRLECYIPRENETYEQRIIGSDHQQEVLRIRIPPLGRWAVFIKYPRAEKAISPQYAVRELTQENYLRYRSKSKYKFLILGIVLFPFLFFLVQFMIWKNKLSFYYLIFLLGSIFYLITILDTIPLFELTPKLITSLAILQRIFVGSTLIILIGLVKYIHHFLNIKSWSLSLMKIGNTLLTIFSVIVLIPLLYTPIFDLENYNSYLTYFRVGALLLFFYSSWVIAIALLKKIQFSKILLITFSPFILCGLYYASSFIITGGYTFLSIESLVMIIGFLLTLLLFGVVLGLRATIIEKEKLLIEQESKRLMQLDQFKSRFYMNITHEFRTPLTVIRGLAGQMKDDRKIKAIILRNADRILKMVNQLLDLTKLETHNLKVHWIHADILPFLKYITESYHSLAFRKNLHLEFCTAEEELSMDFDEEKILQILTNLISNAIKFTPENGSVMVRAGLQYKMNKAYLRLEVTDTGIGIPTEKVAHIFDRFYQVDDTPTRKSEGSGIGLALVKELVHLLQGYIKVKSKECQGSNFLVYLPLNNSKAVDVKATKLHPKDKAHSPPEIEVTALRMDTENKGKPLILVIEDNPDVTHYIVSCLKLDYRIQNAWNGKSGIEKALQFIPDVIICDVMMPELDGFEVCRQLKENFRTSHIPIILLTAKVMQEDRIYGLSQGADAYLTKPFDQNELLVRIANLSILSQALRKRLDTLEITATTLPERESKEVAFLLKLNGIIDDELSNELFNTHFLCQALGMSRTQLHRKLKALTGSSTAHYIRSARLKRAEQLLKTTEMHVGEIAVLVGYKDFSHFTRSFTKKYGLNPSEIRIGDL